MIDATLKATIREYYETYDAPISEIANIYEVSPRTIRHWVENEEWVRGMMDTPVRELQRAFIESEFNKTIENIKHLKTPIEKKITVIMDDYLRPTRKKKRNAKRVARKLMRLHGQNIWHKISFKNTMKNIIDTSFAKPQGEIQITCVQNMEDL